MSRAQRQKGKRGERLLAAALRAAFPEYADSVHRGSQSRFGTDDADVVGLPGFWLESKIGKAPNPRAALRQAIDYSQGRGVPVAVIRDDRCPPFVVLRFDDFTSLVRRALGLPESTGGDAP